MTLKVIILGGSSAVAEAAARLYAREGSAICLVGRDRDKLQAVADDLKVRGAAEVSVDVLDLAHVEPDAVDERFDAWVKALDGVDHVLVAYGVLGDQARMEQDPAQAAELIQTDFASAALWCLAAAARLEAQRKGSLVVIGSVAGDRGRRSNYVYGAAKAGLATLVQGIAHRLAASGARATVVKPGFIDTPMTAHMAKGGPLWSTPEAVARVMRKAADDGGPVVYAPPWWRLILLVIRLAPAPLMHRTRL